MKRIKQVFLVIILSILLAYVTNIDTIPNNIILFENEKINIATLFGINIEKQKELPISSSIKNSGIEYLKKENYEVSFLNTFKIKTVEADIIPKTKANRSVFYIKMKRGVLR